MPGAFLAKIYHARVRARAYAAKEADCGRNMRVSFARFDPVSSSWKIPHFLFQEGWDEYSETWPRWGMMVRGECFQLPPWERGTGATAFGELSGGGIEDGDGSARMFGTSTCRNAPRSAAFKTKTPNLGELVAEERAQSAPWPTPTCIGLDGGSNSRKAAKRRGRYIEGAAAQSATGPTPKAHDSKQISKHEKPRDNLNSAVEQGRTKSRAYPDSASAWPTPCATDHKGSGKDPDTTNCGMLNPDWVEWLMGWPIWWTDLDFLNADGGQCVMPWLDISDDPAEWEQQLMARITTRKTHRVHRIETLGNGQVPLCAAVAFVFGFEILRVVIEGRSAA